MIKLNSKLFCQITQVALFSFLQTSFLLFIKARQLSYISKDKKQHLRILQYQNKDWFSFVGERVEEVDFHNVLNPDKHKS